jgi:crotonobetainyl-CoA:carnitine CoA-transferase CaiB-like acyl-CoA transferase
LKPLAGVKVLEVASWVAAPSACAILADMGADVIKLEPLRGDAMRGILRQAKQPDAEHKVDHAYQVDNRGKESIAVDLEQDLGAKLAQRLALDADILVMNLLPARQVKFGLDPETLMAVRPDLVVGIVSGYGTTGPEAHRAGYDVTAFFGRGGVTDYATERDGVPPLAQPALGDHATGLALLAGLLAALRNAEHTGVGDVVEVSLFGTAIWSMAMEISPALHDGRSPTKRHRDEMITPLSNRYQCSDGKWLNVLMPEVRWWPRFCNALERPQWIDDPRFDSPKARFRNIAEIVGLIDEVMATRTLAQWADIFDAANLIWGPIQSIADVVADPQAIASSRFVELAHPEAGPFRTVANPIAFRSSDTAPIKVAPEIGADSTAVLLRLGLSEAEIAELVSSGCLNA